MSTNPGSESKRTALAAAGFLLVPIVCCGLPVLIAAGALGAVGSVLGNPWVIGTAVVVVLAAVTRFAGASPDTAPPETTRAARPCHPPATSPIGHTSPPTPTRSPDPCLTHPPRPDLPRRALVDDSSRSR